jgi:hypothetical protein
MKVFLAISCAVLTFVGCSPLIPVYAPRRDNNEYHRLATTPQDCLGCHDVSGIRKHDETKNCLRCHRLNEVYP